MDKRILTLAVVTLGLMRYGLWAQAGQISGTVTDEAGNAVAHAQVSPEILGYYVMHTLRVVVKADDKGHFSIGGLNLGEYAVYAFNEAEGYPDTSIPLYRSRPAPRVQLSAKRPAANVNVVIGPKAGIFSASVRDAATHAPLSSQLVIQKADGSAKVSLSQGPDFQVLLPADTDVRIEIHVERHMPWIYAKDGVSTIRLKSGEHVRIDAEVAPMQKR